MKTILLSTAAIFALTSAAFAQGASRPDPSPAGNLAQILRTCLVGEGMREAATVAEYEQVRYQTGANTFYIGTVPFFSTGSDTPANIQACLAKVGAKKR